MFHKFLLTVFLSTTLALAGQTVSPGPGFQSNSFQSSNEYVIGPLGNGHVAASTMTFASPAPTAGISEAGIAGISDHAPIQQGVQSTLGPATVVYTSAPPTVFYTSRPSANSAVPSQVATESASNDLGASFYSGAANAARSAPGMNASLSLGEVAVQNKTRNGAQNARSYTNADVQKLISRRGVGNIMEAANRAPSGAPVPAQDTQVATSAPASPQNTNSGSTATSSAQNVGQPAQNSSNTPAAAAGSPGVGQSADNQAQQNTQSNAGNAGTTPQIRQAQTTDTQENSPQQLPATSTILPLLGLIGLASTGAGLWYRRRICS